MWKIIHIVSNETKAKNIQDKLTLEGFLVKIQPVNRHKKEGYYQILVPGEEAQEAYNILLEIGLL